MNQRSRLEQEVSQRARHTTRDQVSDTRTHAHMEQMLRREYHGRFLVELLQNARDAWLQEHGSPTGGVVRIRLSADPALLVCNQGTRINADTVLYSLGKVGESTKRYGTGIGYKGIGFKAVREVSLCPEIYSQPNAQGAFDLQVRFDPAAALTLIHQCSPQWDALTAQLPSAHATADADPLTSIPLLRFPLWVDEVPPSVIAATRMASESFHTVIRLPYDPRFDQYLAFTQDTWLQRVRTAMQELTVTDEIVVLLEAFTTMLIEDELAATTTCIVREEVGTTRQLANTGTVHDICILRNKTLSSRWRLYKRSLPGFPGDSLEGDIAVGVRLTTEAPDHLCLDLSQRPDLPFHLFFPTHIPTHLPFLLHAYFEVDASRKGFAADAEERNQKLLCGLCDLVVDAVRDLAAAGGPDPVDITHFPTLFARTKGEPEAPLAQTFRNNVLTALDGVPWVRVRAPAEEPRYAAPCQLLVAPEARLAELLPTAFPPAYALRRVDRFHPDAAIAEQGRCFLASRFSTAVRDNLEALLTPGGEDPWGGEQTAQEHGFCAILALLNFLEATDREPIRTLIERLQGNTQATIIPVVGGTTGGYRLIAPPLRRQDTQESEEDSASRIFARRSRGRVETLAPPPCLDIAFVPDGMLALELWEGVARRLLGIRDYLTNAVLDRLAAVLDNPARENPAEASAVLAFIWRLLLQESGSAYSVHQVLHTGSHPGEWYWCTPRRVLSDAGRAAQRHEHALARLPVLTRAGTWRPADELVFGSDWAARLEACMHWEIPFPGWSPETLHQRCTLYRDLEALAPGPDSLVAAPDHLAAYLPFSAADAGWVQADELLALMQEQPADLHLILLHAFLLRLGVWEVLPLKAIVNYRPHRVAEPDPWAQHPGRTAHRDAIRAARGWFFGALYEHEQVQVAEDYQLAWELPALCTQPAFVSVLSRSVAFYKRYWHPVLLCDGCRTHSTRYMNEQEKSQAPSLLAWQLAEAVWVPVTVDGKEAAPVRPCKAWGVAQEPEAQGIRQSPLRFLSLTALPAPLAELVGVRVLDEATPDQLRDLLRELRTRFDDGSLTPAPGKDAGARQAFMGLHRQVYSSLAQAPEQGRAMLDDEHVGVLAEQGTALIYLPRAQVWHDNGAFAVYKRRFLNRVAFAVLARDQQREATTLGISPFHLDLTLQQQPTSPPRDVTDHVVGFLHNCLAEMMSLLVFHRLGGGTLEIGSQNFRDRAQRLRALRVMQVDDVIVEARVSGTDRIIEKFGEGADHDLYLQEPTSARPVLFHDFQMVGWPRVVRQRLAPHIAALVENPAYADTFALLFQLDEPSAREVFLQERGITPEDLDRVRAALQTVGIVASREARCWWQAMLHLLGADPHVPQEDAHLESHICTAMAAVGQAPELIDTLLEGRDIQAVRTDTSPSGVLAMLEKHGFSLQKLDCLLRKSGDPGLQIRVAADWLERWKSTYGRHIAWLLYQHGWSAERAKAAPGQWRVPEHLAWCIVLPEGEVLRDVLNDLHQAGLTPDAQQLAGPEPLSYLAALAKEPDLDAFTSRWRELYDPETQRRLRHEWALAWRLLLVPVLVATGSQPGDHSTRLFTEAERIDKALPPSPQSATELVACVFDLLHAHPALAAKLAERLREDTPPPADLTWISSLVDHEHLDHVRRLLARAPRQQVTHLCQQVVQLQALGIHPTTYYDTRNPILLPVPSPSTYCKEVQARRHHRDAARLNRLGARAEEWALSAVIDPLLALKFSERQSIIHQLVDALRMAYKGKVVERLIGRAQTAMAEDISEEDCLEALIGFLHLSRESDEFGCDLLGWLASSPNASPRPLFLEVKSDHDRRFPVSRAEWERAKVLKDAYAFFVVERSQDDQDGQTVPQRMVILPNPVQLHADQRLGLDPDTWRVSYGSSEF